MKVKSRYYFLLMLICIVIKQIFTVYVFPTKVVEKLITLMPNKLVAVVVGIFIAVITILISAYIWYFVSMIICKIWRLRHNVIVENSDKQLRSVIISGNYVGTGIYNIYLLFLTVMNVNQSPLMIINSVIYIIIMMISIGILAKSIHFRWDVIIISTLPMGIMYIIQNIITNWVLLKSMQEKVQWKNQ